MNEIFTKLNESETKSVQEVSTSTKLNARKTNLFAPKTWATKLN